MTRDEQTEANMALGIMVGMEVIPLRNAQMGRYLRAFNVGGNIVTPYGAPIIDEWSPLTNWEHIGIVLSRLPEGTEWRVYHAIQTGDEPGPGAYRATVINKLHDRERGTHFGFGRDPLSALADALLLWGADQKREEAS